MTSRLASVTARSGKKIQEKHPRGDKLNAGNITQALQSIGGLQSKKNIKPFVIDYDSTNLLLSVVDTGFPHLA